LERHQEIPLHRPLTPPTLASQPSAKVCHLSSDPLPKFAFRTRLWCIGALTRPVAEMPVSAHTTDIDMQTMIEETPVIRKTKELCQTILDQPSMQSIRQRIDAFMNDESSKAQYETLVTKGQALQQKQQQSEQLSGEEIAEFEQQRDALLKNPVARGFLDAQEELHEVKHSIHEYVNKTLELGHLPSEEDMQEGGCGHGGCGCGHSH
jgi:cell fate (sporulation/competence/biofilm development) regulator YlbF (YheA/YmcA/DUF963 family)